MRIRPADHLRYTYDRTDALLSDGGPSGSFTYTVEATPTPMWDITVEEAHSFFVGSASVLAHNACGPTGDMLQAMSDSGMDAATKPGGPLTRAGQEYQKHMTRGELPHVAGEMDVYDHAGQSLLDDLITHPESVWEQTTGGWRVVGPAGVGAVFRRDGAFNFFGLFTR